MIEEGPNQANMAALDAVHAANFVDHAVPPGVPANREGLNMVIQALRAAFPDIHYHIEAEVAEGERLTQYPTAHGRMKTEYEDKPPTGKHAS